MTLGQLEHEREVLDADRLVDARVAEQVGAQRLLLDLLGEHELDIARLGHQVPHLVVHLLVDEELHAVAPLAVAHGARGGHHVLAHVLRRSDHGLAFAELELIVELLADHALLRLVLARRHERHLDEHRRHQVHALEQLQVDVHVKGYEALTLLGLLLLGLLHVALQHHALGEQLLGSIANLVNTMR